MTKETKASAVSACCGAQIGVRQRDREFICMKCKKPCDLAPQDTTREAEPSVRHCGYCSEGYDGNCDGVHVEIPNDANQPHSKIFNKVTPGMLGTEYATPDAETLSEEDFYLLVSRVKGILREATTYENKGVEVDVLPFAKFVEEYEMKVRSLHSQLQASQLRVGELEKAVQKSFDTFVIIQSQINCEWRKKENPECPHCRTVSMSSFLAKALSYTPSPEIK